VSITGSKWEIDKFTGSNEFWVMEGEDTRGFGTTKV